MEEIKVKFFGRNTRISIVSGVLIVLLLYFLITRLPYINISFDNFSSFFVFLIIIACALIRPTHKIAIVIALVYIGIAFVASILNLKSTYESAGIGLFVVLLYLFLRFVIRTMASRFE